MDVSMIPALTGDGVMKRNINDFDGMKDFIISIITVVVWVFIGASIIVGYFTIDSNTEKTVLDYISVIFTGISAMGFTVSIFIYIKQKYDKEKDLSDQSLILNNNINNEISRIIHFMSEIRQPFINVIGVKVNKWKIPPINHEIKILETHSNTTITVDYYTSSVTIPSEMVLSSIYQAAIKINENLSFKTIKAIRLLEESLILYNHIKHKIANENNVSLKCYLIDNSMDSIELLINELYKLEDHPLH